MTIMTVSEIMPAVQQLSLVEKQSLLTEIQRMIHDSELIQKMMNLGELHVWSPMTEGVAAGTLQQILEEHGRK